MKDLRAALFYFLLGGIVFGSLALLSVSFLADHITLVAGIAFTLLMTVLLIAAVIALFKDRILDALFKTTEDRFSDAIRPARDALQHLSSGNYSEAAEDAEGAIRVVAAAYTWLSIRRWILTTAVSVLIAFASIVGSTLVFRQVKLLDSQNRLLEKQNALLQAQNEQVVQQTEATNKQTEVSEFQYQLSKSMAAPQLSVVSDSQRNILVYATGGPVRDLNYEVRSWLVSISNSNKKFGIRLDGLYSDAPKGDDPLDAERRDAIILQLFSEAQTQKAINLQVEASQSRPKCEQIQWVSILVLRYKDLVETSHVAYYDITGVNPKLTQTVPPFVESDLEGDPVNLADLRSQFMDPADQLARMIQESKSLLCNSQAPSSPYVSLEVE